MSAPILALLLPLLGAPEAAAQDHLGHAWLPQDLPLKYEVSTYREDSLPEGYPQEMIQRAYDHWTTYAPCAKVGGRMTGVVPQNTSFNYDNRNRHTFDDPGDTLAPGVLAANVSNPPQSVAQVAFIKNGRTYKRATDTDVVFNNNVQWATEEQMESGNCNGGAPMLNTAVHEIGHGFGMKHTCEEGEPCTELQRLEATMYWTTYGEVCSPERGIPNELDIQNMTSLYGLAAKFECSHELNPGESDTLAVGSVPLTLRCRMISEEPEAVKTASWDFGDGATSTDVDATHTYEEPGNYTVRVCFDFEQESCGETRFCFHREAYVRACGVPEPVFEVHHINGLTYDLRNDTDLSVYGCIYEVQWDVFDANGDLVVSIPSWEPQVTFPEAGDYRVVLNVGGPAGTGAAEMSFRARNKTGEGYGCATPGVAGGTGAFGLGLVAAAGVLVRRRRR